jgi:hypothetical protein
MWAERSNVGPRWCLYGSQKFESLNPARALHKRWRIKVMSKQFSGSLILIFDGGTQLWCLDLHVMSANDLRPFSPTAVLSASVFTFRIFELLKYM